MGKGKGKGREGKAAIPFLISLTHPIQDRPPELPVATDFRLRLRECTLEESRKKGKKENH